MEQQPLSKAESRNMDACLRRLKLELTSMREAGDGLHAQMNSMMGALQELKLLQVQTALQRLDLSGQTALQRLDLSGQTIHPGQTALQRLDLSGQTIHPGQTALQRLDLSGQTIHPGQTALQRLDLSGQTIHPGPPPPPPAAPADPPSDSGTDPDSCCDHPMPEEPVPTATSSLRTSMDSPNSGSLSQIQSSSGTSSSSRSSLDSQSESRTSKSESDLDSVPKRWSGYAAPQVDFCGPVVGNPPPESSAQPQVPPPAAVADLAGILYSLSREGPSMDSDYSQDSAEDGSDWTSSLMSGSRNRQPLVLGDNVFADLVGNWLDLPEVEREEWEEEERRKRREETGVDGSVDRPDSPAHPLRLTRSQEICRKFSLTTNIFKKFLRSVRPDRDKLLKERPGWAEPELPDGELFKRPKKAPPKTSRGSFYPKTSRGSFYLPFWASGPTGKGRTAPLDAHTDKNLPQLNQQHLQFHQNLPQFHQNLPQHHQNLLQFHQNLPQFHQNLPQFHQNLLQFHQQPLPETYLERRQPENGPEKMLPLFDYNTAVWV